MKSVRKVLVYVIAAVLAFTCIPPLGVNAATVPVNGDAEVQTEPVNDDGLMLREYSDFADNNIKKRIMSVDSSGLKHNEKFADYVVEDGIDISYHNNKRDMGNGKFEYEKIDWEKVKADGVDFAIIRMAYRGYGSSGKIVTDEYAYENLEGAKAAGLDVGVYFFSQAKNVAEAKEEANYILDLIKGYDIDLPVVIDYEYTAKSDNGRLWAAKQNGMTDRQRTNACLAFCETVEAAGYDAMVYADKNMLETDLYADEIDDKYEIWLANWTTKTDYEKDYTYWQYTSDGTVNGVPSARVDLNIRYIFDPFRITGFTDTAMTMEWNPIDEAEGYVIYRKTADGNFEIITQIDDPAVTVYEDTGLMMNTAYSYFVRYYKTDENGQQIIYKSGYPAKKAMTTLKLQHVELTGKVVNAGSVKLSWNKEPNATGYVIQQYNKAKGIYVKVATILAGEEDVVEFTKDGLTAATSYKFRVRALADIGGATVYGAFSTPVTVETASNLVKPVLTAKPYNYTTNKLSWTKVPGATAYQIQKYNFAKKKWVLLKTVKGTSTQNTYLNCNTTYRYRVRAVAQTESKKINSVYSAAKNAKTKGSRIGVVKDGPLNIRTGPGTGYKKLIQVKKGRQLTITGSTAKWYRVKIKVKGKFKVGYVSKQYVKLK